MKIIYFENEFILRNKKFHHSFAEKLGTPHEHPVLTARLPTF